MTNSATLPTRPSMPLGSFIAHKRRLAQFVSSQNIRVRYDSTVTTGMYRTEHGELIMPILDIGEDAHDGLLLHEVAHAIFTPQGTAWKDAALRIVDGDARRIHAGCHFLNAIEDPRIERQMKRRFNGASAYFYHLYRWCADNDFFSLRSYFAEGKTLADLNLIDRINLHFKCGAFMQVPFMASEMPFVRRAAMIETWDEAVVLAKELYDLRMQKSDESDEGKGEERSQGSDESGEGEGDEGSHTPRSVKVEVEITDEEQSDGEDSDGEDSDGSQSEGGSEGDESDESDESGSAADAKPNDEMDGDEGESGDEEINTNKATASDDDSDGEVGSIIQAALEEALAKVARKGGRNLHYCTIPEPTDAFVIPMKTVTEQLRKFGSENVPQPSKTGTGSVTVADIARSTYAEWLNDNRSSVAMLGTEFDLRKAADEHRRTVVCDSGTLDMSRLHSFRTDEDIFLRNELVKNGQSHGMAMLIDMSGSMSADKLFYESVSQALMLAHFCRRVNMPFRIYGFTTRGNPEPSFVKGDFGGEKLRHKVVTLMQDGMSGKDFAEVCGLLLVGAYLAEAGSHGSHYPKPIHSAQEQHGGGLVRNVTSAKPVWFNLGDTPLNTALLGMLKVCEDFKRSRSLQMVNLVVLTDGDPTDEIVVTANRSADDYIKQNKPLSDSRTTSTTRLTPYSVWRDPRTGKEYLVAHTESVHSDSIGLGSGHGDYFKPTSVIEMKTILDIFHDRIGGKAICINLVSKYRLDDTITRILNPMTDANGQPISTEAGKALRKDAIARWDKNGWSSLKGGGGFDDYLFVQLPNGDEAPQPTATAATASDEIIRSRKARRPLLVRVAELISK
jgi:Mg-chelatase subunit ChlD